MDKSDLLDELRIEARDRDERAGAPRWLWGAVAAALALLLAGGAGWYFVAAAKAVEVEVATAAAPSAGGGDTTVLQATGYVTARRLATVSAQITGTVSELLIEEGVHVEAGQVLARLDDTAQKAALAQAQAGLHAAQANLGQSQAQLAQSRRDLARAQDLAGRRLVSAQSAEQARTQVDMQSAQVAAQGRQIELAQAQVRAAQVQVDYCTVRAPFSGVITARSAQVGEIVSPLSAGGGFTRTGIGTIVDMDSLEIEVDVTESYINRVGSKQPAEAVLNAYPDWKIPAEVIAIIPTADRSKATVKVRVALKSKDPRIVPDMGVRVAFLEQQQNNAAPPKGVLVPSSAVVQRDGKTVVFVLDAERARVRPVTPGQNYSDLRLVEGIRSGVRVVKDPPVELVDGARIQLKTAK